MTAELLPFPKPSAKDAMDAPIGDAMLLCRAHTDLAVAQIRWWSGWTRTWEDFWRAYWRRPW